jgi:hypothetical protein
MMLLVELGLAWGREVQPSVVRLTGERTLHIHSAALTRPNRLIYVVYVNPWTNKNWLEKSGYFELVREFQVIDRVWSWSLWKPVLNLGGGQGSVVEVDEVAARQVATEIPAAPQDLRSPLGLTTLPSCTTPTAAPGTR